MGKKDMYNKGHVVGIPITSLGYASFPHKSSQILLLPNPADQYQLLRSPSKRYSKIQHGRVNAVVARMIKLGESVDTFAQGIREHVRLGPKLSETVKGKLSLGARILRVGGVEKVFRQKFDIRDD